MSELKVHKIGDYALIFKMGKDVGIDFYLKSEADKVIAELKKEKEYAIEYTTDAINAQEREIRHHKRKRCLAMARWCASRSASWCLDPADEQLHKSDFYDKWKKRWLELAEKFKPNSTAQQGKGKTT